MGEEKWIRRKPGRVSGTVVPPPAVGDTPGLLQRREPGRSRHRPEGSSHGRTQAPPPELPDNVRPLFQPVLRQREPLAGHESGNETAVQPAKPARGGEARPASSRQPHRGPSERAPAAADQPGQAGSALAKDWPASGGWPYDRPAAGRGAGSAAVGTVLAPSPPRAASGAERQGVPAEGPNTSGTGRRHVTWLATLTVLLLLTAAGTTIALLGQRSGGGKPGGAASGKILAPAAASQVCRG